MHLEDFCLSASSPIQPPQFFLVRFCLWFWGLDLLPDHARQMLCSDLLGGMGNPLCNNLSAKVSLTLCLLIWSTDQKPSSNKSFSPKANNGGPHFSTVDGVTYRNVRSWSAIIHSNSEKCNFTDGGNWSSEMSPALYTDQAVPLFESDELLGADPEKPLLLGHHCLHSCPTARQKPDHQGISVSCRQLSLDEKSTAA